MGGTSRRSPIYMGLWIAGAVVLALVAGLSIKQTVAAGLFAGVLGGALFFWPFRLAFALFGLAGMLATDIINVPTIIQFAGLDIILFLIGMMIVIGYLEERRFFEYFVDGMVEKVGPSGPRLVVVLMIAAAISAALVDEVTSILFMAATVFNVAARVKVRPIPLLMMVIFATNIGSAATVVGNPVGVMIALRAGLGFTDFLRYATPIAVAALILCIFICRFLFRSYIKELDVALKAAGPIATEHERGLKDLATPAILFASVILGLILHKPIEHVLGLEKNAMLLGVALLGAGVALALSGLRARELVERRVDWWTLVFFLSLFAAVGALDQVGITGEVARGVANVADGDERLLFGVFLVTAGVLSALMDNVLAVAMFIPVVADLGALGINAAPLWWALLFAGTLFGNMTIIGSTANIVAIGMLERRNLGHISFMEWLRLGSIVALPTAALAFGLLYVQFYI